MDETVRAILESQLATVEHEIIAIMVVSSANPALVARLEGLKLLVTMIQNTIYTVGEESEDN